MQVGQPHVGALDREAPGPVDLAQHAGLVAAHLHDQDADLRLLDEVAVAQPVGQHALGLGDGETAELDAAQQRVADDAGLADARLQRQVRVLVDADAHHVAGAQAVLGRLLGGCRSAALRPARPGPAGGAPGRPVQRSFLDPQALGHGAGIHRRCWPAGGRRGHHGRCGGRRGCRRRRALGELADVAGCWRAARIALRSSSISCALAVVEQELSIAGRTCSSVTGCSREPTSTISCAPAGVALSRVSPSFIAAMALRHRAAAAARPRAPPGCR